MTRKRYIKLKMAEGLSRNEAVQNAREIVEEGLSYQEDYDHDAELPHLTPEQIQNMVEDLRVGIFTGFGRACEILSVAFENVAAACARIASAALLDREKE